MSNYPPGVYGGEYDISGPDREFNDDREVTCQNVDCTEFDKYLEAHVLVQGYRDKEWWSWTCSVCNEEEDFSVEL